MERGGGSDGLAAAVAFAAVEVIPIAASREIDLTRLRDLVERLRAGAVEHRPGDGANQQRAPAEELVVEPVGGRVVREVERHGAHHHAALAGHLGGQGVEIGQQSVTQPDGGGDGVVEGIPLLAETPDLARGVGAVGAEHRQEDGVLRPAGVELVEAEVGAPAVRGVGRHRLHVGEAAAAGGKVPAPEPVVGVVVDEEAADVDGPVGLAGGAEMDALRDAGAQGVPGRADVAIPADGGVAVLAGVGGAGEVHHPLGAAFRALALVDPLGMGQRVGVDRRAIEVLRGLAGVDPHAFLRVRLFRARPIGLEGLGAVAPPGVHAVGEESATGLLPVDLAGGGVEGVVGRLVAEHFPALQHLQLIRAAVGHDRPDGNHQPRAEIVQLAGHRRGIGEAGRIEGLLAPAGAVRPGLPIEHDGIERDLAAAVFAHHVDQFLGVDVAFLRLDEAEGPLRQQGSAAGELMVAAGHAVEAAAVDEVIVQLVHRVGPPARAGSLVVEGHQRAAVEEDAVAAGRDQVGHDHLHVLLIERAGFPPQVAMAFLVRAEPEQRFVVAEGELQGGLEGVAVEDGLVVLGRGARAIDALAAGDGGILAEDIAGELLRRERFAAGRRFGKQRLAGGIEITDRAGRLGEHQRELGSGDGEGGGVLAQRVAGEAVAGADDEAVPVEEGLAAGERDAGDGGRDEGDAQTVVTGGEDHGVVVGFEGKHGGQWEAARRASSSAWICGSMRSYLR